MAVRTTIRVVAPADLSEGYTFQASVDNRPFTVTVPPGGIRAGDEIELPYPFENTAAASSTTPPHVGSIDDDNNDEAQAATGKWRHHLFSCLSLFLQARFWMAICCTPVQIAQLMTRVKLNLLGNPGDQAAVRRTIVGVLLIYIVFAILVDAWTIFIIPLVLYILYISTKVRSVMRKKYKIGGEGNLNQVGDFFMMLACGCCASIQMTRQTHDENQYPYDALSPDGLGIEAPFSIESDVVEPREAPVTVISQNNIDLPPGQVDIQTASIV